MAKITNYIPEPQPEYSPENQRQILESLTTLQNQLNFSFQNDLKEEQDAYNYFLSWQYNIRTKVLNKLIQLKQQCLPALLMDQL